MSKKPIKKSIPAGRVITSQDLQNTKDKAIKSASSLSPIDAWKTKTKTAFEQKIAERLQAIRHQQLLEKMRHLELYRMAISVERQNVFEVIQSEFMRFADNNFDAEQINYHICLLFVSTKFRDRVGTHNEIMLSTESLREIILGVCTSLNLEVNIEECDNNFQLDLTYRF